MNKLLKKGFNMNKLLKKIRGRGRQNDDKVGQNDDIWSIDLGIHRF